MIQYTIGLDSRWPEWKSFALNREFIAVTFHGTSHSKHNRMALSQDSGGCNYTLYI